MASSLPIDHKVLALAALTASAGLAAYSTYRLWSFNKDLANENMYEKEQWLNMYLLLHYGSPEEQVSPWMDFLDKTCLEFPKRCACLALKYCKSKVGMKGRALDVGCGLGRSTFELARVFDHVVGVNYSKLFVDTCNVLKETGRIEYCSVVQGDLLDDHTAVVDPSIERQRVEFQQGDACCLPLTLGRFDCVLAANLIDRLHTPQAFLDRLPHLVTVGGILVLTTPYTFKSKFTPKFQENWIGGWRTRDGRMYTGFDGIRERLSGTFELVSEEELPFVMRETQREFYWSVAHVSIWRRK